MRHWMMLRLKRACYEASRRSLRSKLDTPTNAPLSDADAHQFKDLESIFGLLIARMDLDLLVLNRARKDAIQTQTKIVELHERRARVVSRLSQWYALSAGLPTQPYESIISQLNADLEFLERELQPFEEEAK